MYESFPWMTMLMIALTCVSGFICYHLSKYALKVKMERFGYVCKKYSGSWRTDGCRSRDTDD